MIRKFQEAIMYALRRRDFNTQPALPTGPYELPPLSDFQVKKTNYELGLVVQQNRYKVSIDQGREVGFFEHEFTGVCGQFWLAGQTVVEADHLLPQDVKNALRALSIEV